jgi:hypothetical protein
MGYGAAGVFAIFTSITSLVASILGVVTTILFWKI